ncbi:MAG: ATP synthase F1 subunit delta [Oscillospiraceae bacterium]
MNDKAEKVYSDAFFELCLEECPDKLSDIAEELSALEDVLSANPELTKLMNTPTVAAEEKLALTKDIIKSGNVSEFTGNLLCVLTEKGRFGCFSGIEKCFRAKYNEHFKIAEIVVTTSAPLSEDMRGRIAERMSAVTGMTVSVREKIDPDIIGGIVIDYGSTRYDGSVKARLNAIKNELGSIIA